MQQKMQIVLIPCTPFQQNASIVICNETKHAAIVDPGGDVPNFIKAVEELNITVEKILLTHGHIDHVGGATELAEKLNVKIIGPHQDDQKIMDKVEEMGKKWGMADVKNCTPSQYLTEGESVKVGNLSFEIRHVPGHSPGSIVFINHDQHFALVGDTLFNGSIGRTDFEYGNHDELITNIRSKLFTLEDDYTILPGHGSASTIGMEKQHNPFLKNQS